MKKYTAEIVAFVVTGLILGCVNQFVSLKLLLLERFMPGWGWVEIIMIGAYAAFLTNKFKDVRNIPIWRKRSWLLFSIVFFSQLVLGLIADSRFLMTGNLHIPVPAIIAAGPAFRWEISFMTILFLSTIVLSGPAWCSNLCYFGALDLAAVNKKKINRIIPGLFKAKFTILLVVVAVAIVLRIIGAPVWIAAMLGIAFGVGGIAIILFLTPKKGTMYHCIAYCPIGTIVNYTKKINPYRMYIENECDNCMACSVACKYNALSLEDIQSRKPGITCTQCGDCLKNCKSGLIKFKFPGLNPERSRVSYFTIVIIIHSVFLALARI